jgi:hypothetical protein
MVCGSGSRSSRPSRASLAAKQSDHAGPVPACSVRSGQSHCGPRTGGPTFVPPRDRFFGNPLRQRRMSCVWGRPVAHGETPFIDIPVRRRGWCCRLHIPAIPPLIAIRGALERLADWPLPLWLAVLGTRFMLAPSLEVVFIPAPTMTQSHDKPIVDCDTWNKQPHAASDERCSR